MGCAWIFGGTYWSVLARAGAFSNLPIRELWLANWLSQKSSLNSLRVRVSLTCHNTLICIHFPYCALLKRSCQHVVIWFIRRNGAWIRGKQSRHWYPFLPIITPPHLVILQQFQKRLRAAIQNYFCSRLAFPQWYSAVVHWSTVHYTYFSVQLNAKTWFQHTMLQDI